MKDNIKFSRRQLRRLIESQLYGNSNYKTHPRDPIAAMSPEDRDYLKSKFNNRDDDFMRQEYSIASDLQPPELIIPFDGEEYELPYHEDYDDYKKELDAYHKPVVFSLLFYDEYDYYLVDFKPEKIIIDNLIDIYNHYLEQKKKSEETGNADYEWNALEELSGYWLNVIESYAEEYAENSGETGHYGGIQKSNDSRINRIQKIVE